jgi:tetratricopeptide (TPR) repeat protein
MNAIYRYFSAICLIALITSNCQPPSLLPKIKSVSALESARAKAHLEKGIGQLVKYGQLEKASKHLEQALEQDPSSPKSNLWAAWIAQLLGKQKQAFELFLNAARSADPSAELSIWMAYRIFSTQSQGERLIQVLKELTDNKKAPASVRYRAWYLLGQAYRYLGRFEQAGQAFKKLNYLSQWMMVGPFNNDQNAGFDHVYPPEKKISSYQETYPGKIRDIAWRQVEHFDYDGRINLASLLDPSRWSCAYLVTFIKSGVAQDVAFRAGAYRGLKLWLNDQLLLADDQAHLATMDQYVVGAGLEKGWNKLLVKICQRQGHWQLRLRMTDPAGEQLDNVAYSTKIQPIPKLLKENSPKNQPRYFESWLNSLDDDQFGYKTLLKSIWSRLSGFFKKSVDQAIALSETHPNCPLYKMNLARAHFAADHEASALKAIRAAEDISTNLVDAILRRARYEQQKRRYDRALKILSNLSVKQKELSSVKELTISLLADRRFNYDALQAARQHLQQHPDSAWLWRSIGALLERLGKHEESQQAWSRAFQLRHNHEGTYNKLIDNALKGKDKDQALDWIRRKSKAFPALINSALREAEILLSRDEFDKALTVCKRIEKISPEYWYSYKIRGDIYYRQGNKAQALKNYQKSLEFQPDNSSLREYVDFLEQRKDEVFEEYALTESEIENIISNPPKLSDHPDAESVFMLDDHISHVFKDGSSKHLVRQIFLVRTEKGQRYFNHFRVPSSPSFRLEIAETIQPDGSRQEATSMRRGVIHFPSVEPGSLVHVAYRYEQSSSSWMDDHFAMNFNFQDRYPGKKARWVLVLPKSKELKLLKKGDFIQENQEILADQRVYIFSAQNSPMLHWEPLSPPLRMRRASVYVSTVPSWDVIATWQNSLISDQFEINEAIRKKTRILVQSAQTPIEKLRAIYNFIAQEIRYLNNDKGIFGKKPNKAINIFENRFGDCKDKATLMIAMLKEIGIKAAYAGVRTYDHGPIFWEVPYAQTNHIITYIPAQSGIDKPLFIDGTSRFGDMYYLPDRDQGLRALVLDGDSYEFLETPLLKPHASSSHEQIEARIENDNSLVLDIQERWTGQFASLYRSKLNVEGKRTEELARIVGYLYPGAQLDQVSFSGLDQLTPEAGANYTLKIPERVIQEGKTQRVNLLTLTLISRAMASKPSRYYDVFVNSKNHRKTLATLLLPAKAKLVTLPKKLHINNDYIEYDYSCRESKDERGTVNCSRALTFKTRIIPKEYYQEFRKICNQIDQAEKQDIVFSSKP